MYNYSVALACEDEHGIELGPLCVPARCFVSKDLIHLDTFQLAFRALVKAAYADVADAMPLQRCLPTQKLSGKDLDPSFQLSINPEKGSILTLLETYSDIRLGCSST